MKILKSLLQQQAIASAGIGVMNLPSRKITLDEFTKLNLNTLSQSNPDFQLLLLFLVVIKRMNWCIRPVQKRNITAHFLQ